MSRVFVATELELERQVVVKILPPESRHFYSAIREPDATTSIWQLPVNGDEERRVLHFTDPLRQMYRSTFDVFGNQFYFTIGDRQSDIWTMELKKQ